MTISNSLDPDQDQNHLSLFFLFFIFEKVKVCLDFFLFFFEKVNVEMGQQKINNMKTYSAWKELQLNRNVIAGHFWPTSETTFEWRFASGAKLFKM